MKRFILIAAMALPTAFVAVAADGESNASEPIKAHFTNNGPRAIGGRFGWGGEVSYQHNLGKNFVEIDLGTPGWNALGVQATAIYDFVIAQPQWTPGTWTWYAGPGLQAGVSFRKDFFSTVLGIAGQVGLSYKFEFPLELSVDIRPAIGIQFGVENNEGFVKIYPHTRWPLQFGSIFAPHIGVRYAF